MPSHQSTGASAEQATGTRDDTYDLVSVLYHALQGAETARHYIQDAEQAGDQELTNTVKVERDAMTVLKVVLKGERFSLERERQGGEGTKGEGRP